MSKASKYKRYNEVLDVIDRRDGITLAELSDETEFSVEFLLEVLEEARNDGIIREYKGLIYHNPRSARARRH